MLSLRGAAGRELQKRGRAAEKLLSITDSRACAQCQPATATESCELDVSCITEGI